ncbi:hypothetical protein CTAYLR_007100 [Chrysophaeum taylorii]|uniref:mRNA (guanine-N(7))-methyltransferase n=1 Tax=Chrysophaeum taylorii TaxID=2483200 RepID=A0AAD7XQ68_9STRA|nr:hypothetical protein CTAYLR_007100 [Chrysophaeum taylorii]
MASQDGEYQRREWRRGGDDRTTGGRGQQQRRQQVSSPPTATTNSSNWRSSSGRDEFVGKTLTARVTTVSTKPQGVFVEGDGFKGRALVRASSSVVVRSLREGEKVRVVVTGSDKQGRLDAKLAPAKTRRESRGGGAASGRKLVILDLNGVLCDRGPYKARRDALAVRPRAMEFLSLCFEHFDVAVWSCGKRENMEMSLFDGRSLVFSWDQSKSTSLWPRTSSVAAGKPLFLKELSKVWETSFDEDDAWRPRRVRYAPGETLLIDNHDEKFEKNPPENCAVVPTWTGDDDDSALGAGSEIVARLARFGNFEAPGQEIEGHESPGERFARLFCASPTHARAVPEYPASRYVELADSPGPRAKPLRRRDLSVIGSEPFLVAEKTDGERGWFFQCGLGTFLLRRDLSVAEKLGDDGDDDKVAILDGEMISDQKLFVAFDAVRCDGEDVGAVETGGALERLARSRKLLEREKTRRDWTIVAKTYWRPSAPDLETKIRRVLETGEFSGKDRTTKSDGLIFARARDVDGYYRAVCFKHKPIVTIDFRLAGYRSGAVDAAVVDGGVEHVVASIRLDRKYPRRTIVECDYRDGEWRVLRERPDKSKPNSLRVAWAGLEALADRLTVEDIVSALRRGADLHAANHYDALQKRRNNRRSLDDEMHRLRRLNNLVKALTIERFFFFNDLRPRPTEDDVEDDDDRTPRVLAVLREPATHGKQQHRGRRKRPASILELGCGRGGDLGKYAAKFEVEALVGVDASVEALKEAKRRWNHHHHHHHHHHKSSSSSSSSSRGAFLAGDVGDSGLSELVAAAAESLGRPREQWADLVACQFALHYACGSRDRLGALFTAVARALEPTNGVFVATVVDWRALRDLLRTSDRRVSTLCSVDADDATLDALEALSPDEDAAAAFGLRYTFSLGDAVEACDEFVVHVPSVAALARDSGLDLRAALPFPRLLAAENDRDPAAFAALAADIGVRPARDDDPHPPLSDDQFKVSSLYLALAFVKQQQPP